MKLSQLKLNECARICRMHTDERQSRQLMQLNLCPDKEIRVLFQAPFHSPWILSVDDAMVAVSVKLLEQIEVRRI